MTSCPTGTTQFITGYEGESATTDFGGKVSCEQSSGLAVTLDNTGTDTPSSPTTVYLKYMDGWYSDSNVTNAITSITLPTKSGYTYLGYYTEQNGNGALIINNQGNFKTNNPQLTSTTLYPYFVVSTAIETAKFTLTTTNTTNSFSFSLSAIGTFYVDWGDGDIETIVRNNTTDTTYTHNYSTAGAYTIRFAGGATNTTTSYNTETYIAAISFYAGADNTAKAVNTAKIASVSGNLSSMFPMTSNAADGAQPRFYYTFNGATNLKSIPNTLFADYTVASTHMFFYTFYGCSGLTLLPQNLFFPNATSVTGAESMFDSTFYNCSGLTSLPADLFSKITTAAQSMFQDTFYNCSNLGGYIPPTMFKGLIDAGHPMAEMMFYNTFRDTELMTSCPTGTTQFITGYEGESNWEDFGGKVSCLADCGAGKYLPAGQFECSTCPTNSYCSGTSASYSYSASTDQGIASCASGLYSPMGMTSAGQCGRILHIGDQIMYLHGTKNTTPALHFDIDNDGVADFFGNLTTADVPMTNGSETKLKINYNNTTYSVYDESVDIGE
jgi:hypothetical protein